MTPSIGGTRELDHDVVVRLAALAAGLEQVAPDPRFRAELRVSLVAQAERLHAERALAPARTRAAPARAGRLWRRVLAVGAAGALTAGGLAVASDVPRPAVVRRPAAPPTPGSAVPVTSAVPTPLSAGTAALPLDPLETRTHDLALAAAALRRSVRQAEASGAVQTRLTALSRSTDAVLALVRRLGPARAGVPVVDGPLGEQLRTAASDAALAARAVLATPGTPALRGQAADLLGRTSTLTAATLSRGSSVGTGTGTGTGSAGGATGGATTTPSAPTGSGTTGSGTTGSGTTGSAGTGLPAPALGAGGTAAPAVVGPAAPTALPLPVTLPPLAPASLPARLTGPSAGTSSFLPGPVGGLLGGAPSPSSASAPQGLPLP